MSSNFFYTIIFISINILITVFYLKRSDSKSGCITSIYIGIVIFCINLFVIFSILAFTHTLKESYQVLTSGKTYTATVIDFNTKKVYNSDTEKYQEMNTPTVRFLDENENNIEVQLDFSTSGLAIGDKYKINYNTKAERAITLGFPFIIKIVATFIFCVIFSFLFIGEMLYIFNRKMEGYFSIIKKAGIYFFLPFMLIGFDALLIYALFYGNEAPLIAVGLLVFFILILTLTIYIYLKILFTKGIAGLE